MASNVPISDSKKRAIVVSIDFGTYGTSFAFAYTSDVDKRIVVEMTWDDQEGVYFKNLTQSLYKVNGNKPVAIGFTAGARYNNFEEEEIANHILMRRFKMNLFHQPTADIVDSVSKQKFKPIDIIGDYLAGIKDRIMFRLNAAATSSVDVSQIRFVITIPAIWSELSLDTMKQALVKAGIIQNENVGEEDCMFVLEPEAASAFCKEKALSIGLKEFEDGMVFMVIDAGGGTVDITVHRIENKRLKEETVRNGGACGSTSIDDKFFEWLADQFEPGTINDMLQQDQVAHHNLRLEWERLKVASTNFDADRYMNMPDSLRKLVSDGRLLSTSSDIHKRGRICLSPAVQKEMFNGVLARVAELVEEQISRSTLTIDFVLLVGGFGQCPHLLKLLQEKFVDSGQVKSIAQPGQSGTVVVSGGVLLGLDPSLIRSRRAKLTYGIEVEEVFDESRHEESRLICRDDMFLCKGVFFTFVECGQAIDSDAIVERQFDTTGGTIRVSIYSSPKKKIKFVDEPFVRLLGELTITPPATSTSTSDSKPFVLVRFQFGKIEIIVEAKDHLGTKCEAKLNFANSF